MKEPTPTKRFVIEPLLKCNITCRFCYHLHKKPEWDKYTKPFPDVKKEIEQGHLRGNTSMDITGGEPTIYHSIIESVTYASYLGLETCIITNGLCGPNIMKDLHEAGLSEFLVSIHGLEETHNFVVQNPSARKMQEKFLKGIKDRFSLRFNCVITRWNQEELDRIADWMIQWNPKIVNFINFNPHHSWKNDPECQKIIADLNVAQPHLDFAIDKLREQGIGVNVRYYPMCKVSQDHWECICNDLHVMFDPYEWDYCTTPKTVDRYYEWGRVTSENNEEKGFPCIDCNLHKVCGGANKFWHQASRDCYGEVLKAYPVGKKMTSEDFFFYRGYSKTI